FGRVLGSSTATAPTWPACRAVSSARNWASRAVSCLKSLPRRESNRMRTALGHNAGRGSPETRAPPDAMIAVIGGLGAAVAWAISTLCSSRSSRMIDPVSVVAWVMVVGLLITLPVVAAVGVPTSTAGSSWVWLAASGVGNVAGLVLTYWAMRIGQVGLVAP